MAQSEIIKHLPGRRFFAVWGIAFLLGGLVCFLLVDNFRSRLKLHEKNKSDFLYNTRNIATNLEYFFEERRFEMNSIACSPTIAAYFENQAMGMSMEYGLKASLLSAQEHLSYILKQRKVSGHLIYRRFMLVGREGHILLDCTWSGQQAGLSPCNLYSVFKGKPKSEIVLLGTDNQCCVVISVPCYLKENYAATLLAIVNTDTILSQMGIQDGTGSKNILIFDKNSRQTLNETNMASVHSYIIRKAAMPLSKDLFYFADAQKNLTLCASVPISNTPFYVLNTTNSGDFDTGNPWIVPTAMILLAVMLFGGGIFVYRSAARNLILRVRLEEKNNQQQTLETINLQLEQEIARRRRKENQLKEKETYLQATIESTTEGILVVNQEGLIANWNRSFREIWKMPEIKPLATISEMKDFFLEQTQGSESFINEFCYLQNSTDRFSGTLTLKTGSVIEYYARPMKVQEAIGSRVWSFRDITLHKNAEKTLQQAKEAAEKSNQAKNEFLTNLSHELRTPLNSILGFAGVLSEETLTDSQKTYIENIHKSGLALLEMLDNLLLFSDSESEQTLRVVRKCAVWDIVNLARKRMLPKIRKKDLQMDVICRQDPPMTLYSDPQMIAKILTVILDNACKFTEQGHILLTISPSEQGGRRWIQFAVEDSGVGIHAEKLQNIFDLFMQADSSKTRRHGGIGTGLPAAKKLAEMLNGRILVQSESGKGTTFTVILPVCDEHYNQLLSKQEAVLQTTSAANPSL